MNLDVAVERRLRILQPNVTLAATKEREEDLAKVLAHLRESLEEEIARGRVDLANGLLQRCLCVGEIGALRREKIEALRVLLMLFDGEHVDEAEGLELLPEHLRLFAERRVVELHGCKGSEHFVEQSTQFGLEPLADRRATSRQLRESHLGAMELVVHRTGAVPDLVERMLGSGE